MKHKGGAVVFGRNKKEEFETKKVEFAKKAKDAAIVIGACVFTTTGIVIGFLGGCIATAILKK